MSIPFCQSLIESDLETKLGPGLDWFQLNLDRSSVRPQCLVASVRPAGPLHSLQNLQTVFWENWQKPAKVKNSHPSQPAQISIRGAWVREEGEVSCPFLPIGRKNISYRSSLPGTALAFLFISFCDLSTLPGSRQVGCPPNTAGQKCGLHSILG